MTYYFGCPLDGCLNGSQALPCSVCHSAAAPLLSLSHPEIVTGMELHCNEGRGMEGRRVSYVSCCRCCWSGAGIRTLNPQGYSREREREEGERLFEEEEMVIGMEWRDFPLDEG